MLDALKNLLAPGNRSRLSPYVQDAQLQVLFGEKPDPLDRHNGLNRLLKRHAQGIRGIAKTCVDFQRNHRPFCAGTYQSEDFLRFYLAY